MQAGAVGLCVALAGTYAHAQDARLDVFPPSPLARVGGEAARTMSTAFAPSGSTWATRHPEQAVFLARLRHVERNTMGEAVPARGFDIRIGQGGQIWSWRGAFGESVAPQFRAASPERPDPDVAPWMDEVWQIVALSRPLHDPDAGRPYFIHQAGVYLHPPALTRPFYSPVLAAGPGAAEGSYVVVSWSQQAHVPTAFRSGLLTYTQHRDVGAGIVEVTVVAYNAGTDVLDRWNVPWGGVRHTSLPVHELSLGGRLVTLAPGIEFGDAAERDRRDRPDGYGLFRTEAGDAALALVFGRDRRASLGAAQWADAFYRSGVAQPGTGRNLRVSTVVRPLTVRPGEALWARWYFVVGSRTASLSLVDTYGLVDRAGYGVLRLSADDSPLLGYAVDASTGAVGGVVEPQRAGLLLWARPVADSTPVLRLVGGGTTVVSPSPYALSPVPYDGRTQRWELLGYAPEAHRATPPREGFERVPIESVVTSGYRAAGTTLHVLRPARTSRDAGPPDATTMDATTLDATTLDATTLDATALDAPLPDATATDAPVTPEGGPAPDDAMGSTSRPGCSCTAVGPPRTRTPWALCPVLASALAYRRRAARRRGARPIRPTSC